MFKHKIVYLCSKLRISYILSFFLPLLKVFNKVMVGFLGPPVFTFPRLYLQSYQKKILPPKIAPSFYVKDHLKNVLISREKYNAIGIFFSESLIRKNIVYTHRTESMFSQHTQYYIFSSLKNPIK